jgi:hypothetical protein
MKANSMAAINNFFKFPISDQSIICDERTGILHVSMEFEFKMRVFMLFLRIIQQCPGIIKTPGLEQYGMLIPEGENRTLTVEV